MEKIIAKEIVGSTGKELELLTHFQVRQKARKMAYHEVMDLVSQLELKPYNGKKGNTELPNGKGLIIQFNAKTKKCLGYSCNEIDQIQDLFLSGAVEQLRYEAISIYAEYLAKWDGSLEMYEEMKALLWALPEIAKENLQNKREKLERIKR